MKNIQNKLATLTINGKETTIQVADLLRDAINLIPKEGLTPADIQKRLRVLSVVDKAKAENLTALELEDADFKTATECVAQMRWAVVDPFIIEFTDMFK